MRYLPLTAADRNAMLRDIGVASVDALFADVPEAALLKAPIQTLPQHQTELAVERHMLALANENIAAGSVPCFLGAGAYRHHVPASVDYLIQRGEFLTSYTPYQPEVSQGTLQYLYEFQSQVALLTGMDVANASMYDGATAAAEAVAMAHRITGRKKALLAESLHPHYAETIEMLGRTTGFATARVADVAALLAPDVSCVVVQTPDIFGNLHDYTDLAQRCRAHNVLLIVAVTEILSLGLLKPPGEMGADIVVAEGQSLGNGLNFGGPYVGLFATRDKYVRQMPGRLCGETTDAAGERGYVLTLSTREQHIRREKATSNICTNSGLCALAFTIHLTLLGDAGLRALAQLNHARAVQCAEKLEKAGLKILNKSFFNEFAVDLGRPAAPLIEKLAKEKLLAGVPASRLFPHEAKWENILLVAVTETVTDDDMDALVKGLQHA